MCQPELTGIVPDLAADLAVVACPGNPLQEVTIPLRHRNIMLPGQEFPPTTKEIGMATKEAADAQGKLFHMTAIYHVATGSPHHDRNQTVGTFLPEKSLIAKDVGTIELIAEGIFQASLDGLPPCQRPTMSLLIVENQVRIAGIGLARSQGKEVAHALNGPEIHPRP